jgi:rsbT antagonist protein RsbS
MARNIPIIKIYDNLLVSIQIELSDHLVNELKDNITDEIQNTNPKGLIIEVSGIDILDSYIARSIRDISQIAKLMGVRSVISGLDPAMAVTLVEMGLYLTGTDTALNLEAAIYMLEENKRGQEIDLEEIMDEVTHSNRERGTRP